MIAAGAAYNNQFVHIQELMYDEDRFINQIDADCNQPNSEPPIEDTIWNLDECY